MEWEEEYSIGIPEIDQQHRVIVECITLVEEAVSGKNEKMRWSAVHGAIGRLADYVRIHFAVEESLMRMHGFPELEQHIEEHLRFANDLSVLQRRSLGSDVSEDMVAFLSTWLRGHVTDVDRRYADFLPGAPVVRKSPAKKKKR